MICAPLEAASLILTTAFSRLASLPASQLIWINPTDTFFSDIPAKFID